MCKITFLNTIVYTLSIKCRSCRTFNNKQTLSFTERQVKTNVSKFHMTKDLRKNVKTQSLSYLFSQMVNFIKALK